MQPPSGMLFHSGAGDNESRGHKHVYQNPVRSQCIIISLIARLCPSVRASVHSRYLGPPGDACRVVRRSRRPEPVWDV